MQRPTEKSHARPVLGALLAAGLAALLVAGGIAWVGEHRALELRLALAQAKASRLAGLLNVVLARVDQAAIALALSPRLADMADCRVRALQTAETLSGTVTGFALIDPVSGIDCASTPSLFPNGGVISERWPHSADAPMASFIMAGSTVLDPVVIIRRQTPDGRIVLAGLRVEALRRAAGDVQEGTLEDSRGTRVALADGRVTDGLPAAYFPPPATGEWVPVPPGRRVVARIGDHLAITLDIDGGTSADARAAAMLNGGWVFLVLAGGLLLTLLVLRLTLLRPMHRLGEQLDRTTGTEGLIDWLSAQADTPMRPIAERIIRRELDQEQRLALREAMLREVNHRVAGHLQMVVSLLRLQAREAGPPEVGDALRRAEYRVNTLALVHQGLQQARRGERLEVLGLLRRLAFHLVEGSPAADSIALHVEGQSLVVPPEIGLPVALILNEWLTRALRRGQPPSVITIGLWRQGGGAVLEFHEGGVAPGGPESPGLSLSIVEALCAQIRGSITRRAGPGWRLSFAVDGGPDT